MRHMNSFGKLPFAGILCSLLSATGAFSHANPPPFDEYPAKQADIGNQKITLPDFSGDQRDFRDFRTRITEGMNAGPNFAGQYSLIEIGCGMSCRFVILGNVLTGELVNFPFGGESSPEMTLIYKVESRVLRVTAMESIESCLQQDLLFDGTTFELLGETTFPRENSCN